MYKKFIFLYLTYEINTIKDFFAFEILRLFEKSNYLIGHYLCGAMRQTAYY